jgi:hypothetical protein
MTSFSFSAIALDANVRGRPDTDDDGVADANREQEARRRPVARLGDSVLSIVQKYVSDMKM